MLVGVCFLKYRHVKRGKSIRDKSTGQEIREGAGLPVMAGNNLHSYLTVVNVQLTGTVYIPYFNFTYFSNGHGRIISRIRRFIAFPSHDSTLS